MSASRTAEPDSFEEKVAVLVRFHDSSKMEQLSVCLLCLEAQEFAAVEPVILTQRFSEDEVAGTQALLEQFSWSPDVRPRVINVQRDAPADLRCVLLNVGVEDTADARFLAVFDYDDFCGQSHYARLIGRLRSTEAAIAYSGCITLEQTPCSRFSYTTSRRVVVRPDFPLQNLYSNPNFLMTSFVLDRAKIDKKDIWFDEAISYEEDYNLQLRISMNYPSDFVTASEKVPALMRTVRNDGSNSIVTRFDDDDAAARKRALLLAGKRANGRLRVEQFREEFDPFCLLWVDPLPIRGGNAYNWLVYATGVGLSQIPKRNHYGHLRVFHSPRYNGLVGGFAHKGWAIEAKRDRVEPLERLFEFDVEEEKPLWDEGGVAVWRDLMNGRGAAVEIEREMLDDCFEIFPFRTVMTFGVNGAVAGYARDNGLKHVSLELGPTRAPYLETGHCDPFGVNGESMIARLPEGFMLPELPAEKWVDTFVSRSGIAIRPVPERVAAAKALGGKVALLPLQLCDDANFLLHADRYAGFVEFLEHVTPPLIEAGWTCLVRPHPHAERAPFTKADNDACAEWVNMRRGQGVEWFDDDLTVAERMGMLDAVDAVVSVNSSLAFEAMLFDTPVVVTGRSSFALPGHMPTLDDLLSGRDLSEILALQRRLVAFNLFHQFVPVGELFSPQTLMRRLAEAEAIEESFAAGGPVGLAEHLLRDVRSKLIDYYTMGRSPLLGSQPRALARSSVLTREVKVA